MSTIEGAPIPIPARHQHIQPAKTPFDFTQNFRPARLAGDVLMQGHRFPARQLDAGTDLRPVQLIDVGHHDRGALIGEQLRDRPANARRAASHERNFACHLPRHLQHASCASNA
jgi:hypothetical protein